MVKITSKNSSVRITFRFSIKREKFAACEAFKPSKITKNSSRTL